MKSNNYLSIELGRIVVAFVVAALLTCVCMYILFCGALQMKELTLTRIRGWNRFL